MPHSVLYVLAVAPIWAALGLWADYYVRNAKEKNRSDRISPVFQRWQLYLIGTWSFLDDIKPPKLGLSEAASCLNLIDSVFSRKFFSPRRLWASTLVWALLVSLYYLLVEGYRLAHGMPSRPPFIPPHRATNPFVGIVTCMATVSMTRFVVSLSIKIGRELRYQTLAFFILIVLSTLITAIFAGTFVGFATRAGQLTYFAFEWVASLVGAAPRPQLFFASSQPVSLWEFVSSTLTEEVYVIPILLRDSIHANLIRTAMNLVRTGARLDTPTLLEFYSWWVRLVLSMARVVFAGVFFIMWGLYYFHKAAAIALERLSELEIGGWCVVLVVLDAVVATTFNFFALK